MKAVLTVVTSLAILLSGGQISIAAGNTAPLQPFQSEKPRTDMQTNSGASYKPEFYPILLTANGNEVAKPQLKILTDYPGRARAVTDKQKSEIRAVLDQSKGNTKFICSGIRLEGQPQAMNRVVRLRAKLVCEYAKSLRPEMSFWYQTKITQKDSYNGRVMIASK